MLIPLLVLALSLPLVSPEIELTTPVLAPAANGDSPAIATDGSDYLVVWRAHSEGMYWLQASRVTHDGTLLDPLGIPIAAAALSAAWMAPPELQFAGGRYIVTRPMLNSLEAFAVDPDGTLVAGRMIGPASTGVQHRAATNGERTVVAWDNGGGVLLDNSVNTLATLSLTGPRIADVASDGSEFLVFSGLQCAGADCPRTFVADRFAADGQKLSTRTTFSIASIPGATAIDDAAATYAGGRYILFLRIEQPTADDFRAGSILALTLDANGEGVGTPIVVQNNARTVNRMRAHTDAAGRAVLVFEHDAGTLVARLNVATRTAVLTHLEDEQAALASASGSSLLVTGDVDAINARLTARFVAPDLAPDPSRPQTLGLGLAAPAQDDPLVQTNGSVFLVVWNETSGRDVQSLGAIVDRTGRVLAGPLGPLMFPRSIASDGADFLLAGGNGSSVHVQRIAADGTVLDPQPRTFGGSDTLHVAAVWNGSNYVLFTSGRDSATGPFGHVDAISVSRTGELLGVTPISPRTNAQLWPVAASDGERTLVVWKDVTAGCQFTCVAHLDAAILDRENRILAMPRLFQGPVDPSSAPTALAQGGSSFLLAWWKAATPRAAYATRFAGDGSLMMHAELETPVASVPKAAWNGSTFDLTWLHEEPAGDGDIVFRRGDAAPVIVDALESEKQVVIAAIPHMATLLVYSRNVNDALHGATTRLFMRTVRPPGGRTRAVRLR